MNGPLTVVKSGANINTTNIHELITDTTIPFTKLDTQNVVSFQTISLLFNKEPAQPPASAPFYSITQVYQFPHGYSYVPSIWLMWQNSSPEFPPPPTIVNSSATTYYPFGDDTSGYDVLGSIQLDSFIESGTQLASQLYLANNGMFQTTAAQLYATVDATNVYINIIKFAVSLIGGNAIPLFLAGVTLDIRCYVFTEPADTSIY